jgi:dihydrofolate synthase/folylpolyglutamate synthase
MGLERVEQLLSLLGDPHKKLRVVQVVGTNGKGTTAVALAAALSQADQSAGVYLSPHVLSYTERVMLGGAFVSEERFARAMGEAIEVADRHGVSASQFELLTAGAVKLFADERLGWAVLEAGLGARYDATTAARPEAVVLTNVGLDHAEYLGDSVQEISHEKLASLSPGSVLVLGTDDATVRDIARRRCAEVDARLVESRRRSRTPVAGPAALRPSRRRARGADRRGVAGAEARHRGTRGSGPGCRRGVAGAVRGARGRRRAGGGGRGTQRLGGWRAALEAVRAAYGGRPLAVVFGVLRDKDARSMLTALNAAAPTVVLTRPEGERAVGPDGIVQGRGRHGGGETLKEEDPVGAVRLAVRASPRAAWCSWSGRSGRRRRSCGGSVTSGGIWRLVGLLVVVAVACFVLGYVVMVRFIS